MLKILIRTTAFALPLLAIFTDSLCCRAQAVRESNRTQSKLLSAVWHDQTLKEVVGRIAALSKQSVWIDRRVDSQQTIEIRLLDITPHEALAEIAASVGLGTTLIGDVVYLGHRSNAGDLLTLRQLAVDQLEQIPEGMKSRWQKVDALVWPRLAPPRELIQSQFDGAGIELVGGEQVPHDLWDARTLAPLSLVDRAVLLLAGFDLKVLISDDGRRCELVPINRPVAIERTYRVPASRQRALDELIEEHEADATKQVGHNWLVRSKWEVHLQIQATLEGKAVQRSRSSPVVRNRLADQVFSLRLENQPVGKVIEQLAAQLKLEVTWQDEDHRERLCRCAVEQVGIDELLQAILSSVGLECSRRGRRVEVYERYDEAQEKTPSGASEGRSK